MDVQTFPSFRLHMDQLRKDAAFHTWKEWAMRAEITRATLSNLINDNTVPEQDTFDKLAYALDRRGVAMDGLTLRAIWQSYQGDEDGIPWELEDINNRLMRLPAKLRGLQMEAFRRQLDAIEAARYRGD